MLRCVFWLTIVFWSMSWTTGTAPQPRETLRAVVAAKGTAFAGAARAAVVGTLSAEIAGAADRGATAWIGKTLAVHGLGAGATATHEPAAAWCGKSEAECGRDAARLTALVATNLDELAGAEATPGDAGTEQTLPLPPLDPRRRVIVRELTRAP
jgi:hypothetical protein